MPMRHTIAREVAAEGIALHAGTQVRMMLAPANSGAPSCRTNVALSPANG